jgi:hypothetical protein
MEEGTWAVNAEINPKGTGLEGLEWLNLRTGKSGRLL